MDSEQLCSMCKLYSRSFRKAKFEASMSDWGHSELHVHSCRYIPLEYTGRSFTKGHFVGAEGCAVLLKPPKGKPVISIYSILWNVSSIARWFLQNALEAEYWFEHSCLLWNFGMNVTVQGKPHVMQPAVGDIGPFPVAPKVPTVRQLLYVYLMLISFLPITFYLDKSMKSIAWVC